MLAEGVIRTSQLIRLRREGRKAGRQTGSCGGLEEEEDEQEGRRREAEPKPPPGTDLPYQSIGVINLSRGVNFVSESRRPVSPVGARREAGAAWVLLMEPVYHGHGDQPLHLGTNMSAEMSNIGHKTMYFVTQYTAICIPECERGQLLGEARSKGDKRVRLPPAHSVDFPRPALLSPHWRAE